jgi:hypothetical protein
MESLILLKIMQISCLKIMAPKTNKKEINKLLKKCEKQKWRFRADGPHIMCYSPDGVTMVLVSKSPASDSTKKVINDLRKGGFKL